MISDAQFQELGDLVTSHMQGCRPVETAQIELLAAILTELRTIRKDQAKLVAQFGAVSGAGQSVLVTTS